MRNNEGKIVVDQNGLPMQGEDAVIGNCLLYTSSLAFQVSPESLQVELAQYKYMLPRLQRLWTHLERQGGGSGDVYKRQVEFI